MSIAMNVVQRACSTKGELRLLRQEGKVPGVIYGKQLGTPVPIMVELKELEALLRTQPNAVLDMDIASIGKHSAMVSEVQRDSLSRQLLHVDFRQINMNETVKTQVRFELEGEAGGVKEGGILQMVLHDIEVQCLPTNIPESIVVDISALAVGESVLVRDLIMPQGVEVKSDPELVVLTILAPQKELSEEAEAELNEETAEAESRSQEARLEEVEQG